jgi:hypothetical protein
VRRLIALSLLAIAMSACDVIHEPRIRIECGRLGPAMCDAAARFALRHRPGDRQPVVAIAADDACPANARGCGLAVGRGRGQTLNVVLLYADDSADMVAFDSPEGEPWADGWLHVGRIPGHLADLLDIEPRDGTGLILPLAVPGEPLGTPVLLPPDEVGL